MVEGGPGCPVRLQWFRAGDLEAGCELRDVCGRGAAYKVERKYLGAEVVKKSQFVILVWRDVWSMVRGCGTLPPDFGRWLLGAKHLPFV